MEDSWADCLCGVYSIRQQYVQLLRFGKFSLFRYGLLQQLLTAVNITCNNCQMVTDAYSFPGSFTPECSAGIHITCLFLIPRSKCIQRVIGCGCQYIPNDTLNADCKQCVAWYCSTCIEKMIIVSRELLVSSIGMSNQNECVLIAQADADDR